MLQETKQHIYSVSELTKVLKFLLEDSFPTVWIEGEISNLSVSPTGHVYLVLKDEHAVLKCVIWKQIAQSMKFKLEDGQRVMCFGSISVYEKSGQYQLYIEKLEPKGIGSLTLAFEQLKARLAKEGLFDGAHKRPIPFLPKAIGIVTSPTGAVVRDMLSILKRRFANLEIIIYPVRVQGKGAEVEIKEAIENFNRFGKIDVMILARGGGSIEDLWAFNEEIVAQAIYRSTIPVISAIGHETDYTIADFTADLRAPTPSAAAELVVTKKEELSSTLEYYLHRLTLGLSHLIEIKKEKCSAVSSKLKMLQPINMLRQYQQRVDELIKHLTVHTRHLLQIRRHTFKRLIGELETLSPLAVLSRGYSITTIHPHGEVIRDIKVLQRGDTIKTRLSRGHIISTVEDTHE
ncbi:MAG: exodeoxyribonuclease VII large subunit [Candidatus Omnitrophota bacterium]